MASPLRNLVDDDERTVKSFQMYLECSTNHKSIYDFFHSTLPNILASIGDGKTTLNVIGVGTGRGELDLELVSQLHLMYPDITVDNEVVEPNCQQLHYYKDLVSKRPDLDYIKFTWNKMTASEFEQHCKSSGTTKKADFIHLIQVLYYVKDPGATISFFQSLLHKKGKLLICLGSDECGWYKIWRTYRSQLCNSELCNSTLRNWSLSTSDIKCLKGVVYQSYVVPCQMDVTECFTEGNEKGELLLDFLTGVLDFSQTAPPELKAGVLGMLRHKDCSVEHEGKVLLNSDFEVLVLDPLP